MDDSLERRDAGNPTVEVIVRPKVPAGQPHEKVVPHAKEPDDGEVGERDDAGSIGNIAPDQMVLLRPTRGA